ncbi:MAG: MBL fold metallo-hydrolase, partial [Pyrinomonadaceae bacterium]|nr:MBL fold metallo-hydrolase [Pyrinomonadaceae bacterium]
MKLIVFQSDKGDCLLVEGDDGKTVLTDGGMAKTYSNHVAPFLNNMQQNGKELDAVYVSHIDEDHISGVLQMMDDAVEWRIYDYQTTTGGNPNFKQPDVLRPPQVDRVWHNAFHEQVADNTGDIEDMLAATVAVLAGGDSQRFLRMAQFHQDVATSINQAINLSRKLGEKQLDIKLNPEAKGKLMMLRRQQNGKYNPPIKIGKMKWILIGPTEADLKELRKEWDKWLVKNQKALARIDENARRAERNLGNSLANEVGQIVNVANKQAELLAYSLLDQLDSSKKKVLGLRRNVTAPNLASLMFLTEEKNAQGKTKTILLTGDGHHEDILKGLELQNKIKLNETLFVDVLKIPHHGSEHNSDREFYKKIIADHYVFCGNGAHENPDLDIMKAVIESRLVPEHQGVHPKINQPFKLWFNSFPQNPEAEKKDNDHLEKV